MTDPGLVVRVVDHQGVVDLGDLPERIEQLAAGVIDAVWKARTGDQVPLAALSELEVALIDDAAIAEVHGRFLDDPTATDVITFDHGEILIGVETARRQAAEFGEALERELLRYFVHGLLHLAGHEDGDEECRGRMIEVQERIVAAQ